MSMHTTLLSVGFEQHETFRQLLIEWEQRGIYCLVANANFSIFPDSKPTALLVDYTSQADLCLLI